MYRYIEQLNKTEPSVLEAARFVEEQEVREVPLKPIRAERKRRPENALFRVTPCELSPQVVVTRGLSYTHRQYKLQGRVSRKRTIKWIWPSQHSSRPTRSPKRKLVHQQKISDRC